ncbi:MAG: hypothetical protein AVDCRST_MAG79-3052, partial [uncultured Thermoleophilia bacterium]
ARVRGGDHPARHPRLVRRRLHCGKDGSRRAGAV